MVPMNEARSKAALQYTLYIITGSGYECDSEPGVDIDPAFFAKCTCPLNISP